MGHEISQFDISDRQMLVTNAQRGLSIRSDIGEAKITRTIFGKAKVRVIREQDKILRAWLLAALLVTVLATAAWQGWIAWQQVENVAPPLSLSERIWVSPPVFVTEDNAPVTASSSRNKIKTPTQIILDSMATRREPAPAQPLGLKDAGKTAATAPHPLPASKPQTASVAANNSPTKIQTDMRQPPKPPVPVHPAAPAQPAATFVATPPAIQPAVNKPADVAPLADPLIGADSPPPLPAVSNQPPGNVQPQVNARGTAIEFVQPPADSQP